MKLIENILYFFKKIFGLKNNRAEDVWETSTRNLDPIQETIKKYQATNNLNKIEQISISTDLVDRKAKEEIAINSDPVHEKIEEYQSTDNFNKIEQISISTDLVDRKIIEIKKIIRERDIKYLTHFTRLENLSNIMSHGILGKEHLDEYNLNYITNDEIRLDNIYNSICTSISHPNYKMFYKYRKLIKKSSWVVIKLDPKILYELDCIFCFSNAASKKITNLDLNYLKSIEALEKMFNIDNVNREYLNIPLNYTTDPQAEVIFLNIIPSKYILEINFTEECNELIYELMSNREYTFKLSDELFKPRKDYKFWMKSN